MRLRHSGGHLLTVNSKESTQGSKMQERAREAIAAAERPVPHFPVSRAQVSGVLSFLSSTHICKFILHTM